jgi:hypothetical protein
MEQLEDALVLSWILRGLPNERLATPAIRRCHATRPCSRHLGEVAF